MNKVVIKYEMELGHFHLIISGLIGLTIEHSYYLGKCPKYKPMEDFNWEQFSDGKWYIVAKSSESARCFTETYNQDENGFKTVTQVSFKYKCALKMDPFLLLEKSIFNWKIIGG